MKVAANAKRGIARRFSQNAHIPNALKATAIASFTGSHGKVVYIKAKDPHKHRIIKPNPVDITNSTRTPFFHHGVRELLGLNEPGFMKVYRGKLTG